MDTGAITNDTTVLLDIKAVTRKILAAERRLSGIAHRTPVHTSRTLDRLTGHAVHLKCENLQRAGAFKFRGAYNSLSALNEQQRAAGVLTFSSGNHAQAMALAGQLLGISVTVVMPANAPTAKLAATKEYGAEVVLYDPATQQREQVAAALPQAKQAVLIPPFDHYDVIAGQGTAALELHQHIKAQGLPPLQRLLVPVGGGGLLAGTAVATHLISPQTQVIGVEPENADDAARSFKSGRIVTISNPDTIADGTRTPSLGVRNFALIKELVTDIVTVSEAQIKTAMRFLFERNKLVVEPSGVLGVAALLAGTAGGKPDGASGVILSGGNVDNELFARIITAPVSD